MPDKYIRIFGILKGYKPYWAYYRLRENNRIPTITEGDDDYVGFKKFKTYMELIEAQNYVDQMIPIAKEWLRQEGTEVNGRITIIP